MLYGRIGVTFVYEFALRSMILEGSGLQLPLIGTVKENSRQDSPEKWRR